MEAKDLGIPELDMFSSMSNDELLQRLHDGVSGRRTITEAQRLLIVALLNGRAQMQAIQETKKLINATWILVAATLIVAFATVIAPNLPLWSGNDVQQSAQPDLRPR